MRNFIALIYIIINLLCLFACSSDKEKVIQEQHTKIEEEKQKDTIFSLNYPEIKYQKIHISNNAILREILDKYKETPIRDAYIKTIKTLNRKDLRAFAVGQDVVIPDSIIDDVRAYSVFPDDYPGAKKIDKLIMVCNAMQCYACYEYGNLVRFAAANTGKERTPTFPGRYALVWKQRLRISSLDSTWKMPYTFNFHQFAGSAMHQFSMPGRPVSHSCIRQFEDDAAWIYSWGKGAKYDTNKQAIPLTGTPLIILNVFDYSRVKGGPWLELTSNKSYYVDLPQNPMEVEEALIPYQQIPKSSRGILPNKQRYIDAEKILRERKIIRDHVELISSVDFNEVRRNKAKAKAEKERLEKLKQEEEAKKLLKLEETKEEVKKIEETENK